MIEVVKADLQYNVMCQQCEDRLAYVNTKHALSDVYLCWAHLCILSEDIEKFIEKEHVDK